MAQGRSLVPEGTKVLTSSPSSSSTRRGLLTSSEEAWTSTVLPASVHLVFPTPVAGATHLAITFQGGFVATSATVYIATRPRNSESSVQLELAMGGKIYPEDKNKRQVFRIPYPPGHPHLPSLQQSGRSGLTNGAGPSDIIGADMPEVMEIKIEFEQSSDQYGRITVYQIEILG